MESALPEHQIGGDAVTTVGEVVLEMMGRLRPKPAPGDSASTIAPTQVDPHGGMPLMEALAARRSSREFATDPLPLPLLAGVSSSDVIRAWIDRDAIAEALGLTHDQQVLFSQTLRYPNR